VGPQKTKDKGPFGLGGSKWPLREGAHLPSMNDNEAAKERKKEKKEKKSCLILAGTFMAP